MVVVPSKTFPGPMKSYTVKENHSENLQTDRQTQRPVTFIYEYVTKKHISEKIYLLLTHPYNPGLTGPPYQHHKIQELPDIFRGCTQILRLLKLK